MKVLASLVACLGAVSPVVAQVTFEFMQGAAPILAHGLSPDGSTVVGSANFVQNYIEAWRWTAPGGTQQLGLPNHSARVASWDGSVIAGNYMGGAFRRTTSAVTYIPELLQARAISWDGAVIAGQGRDGNRNVAALWSQPGGLQLIGALPGAISSSAVAISENGVVAGWSTFEQGIPARAMRWSPGAGLIALHPLATFDSSSASGISQDGSAIVGSSLNTSTLQSQACRWLNGEPEGLGLLPGANFSSATGISADGSVIAGISGNSPFLWVESTGMINVRDILAGAGYQLDGFNFDGSVYISADGRTLAGRAGSAAGGGYALAWVATIPSPGGIVVAALGLSWATRRRRVAGTNGIAA